MSLTTFFGSPGEVEEYSVYAMLPKGMVVDTSSLVISADADVVLANGQTIAKTNVNEYFKDKFVLSSTTNYKSSDYTLVAIKFNDTNGICYDSTKANGFTSGKITLTFNVSVPNESNNYDVV